MPPVMESVDSVPPMSATESTKPKKRQMKIELDTDFEGPPPPLRKKKGCDGPVWVPLRVYGYTMDRNELVTFAENHVRSVVDAIERSGGDTERHIHNFRRQDAMNYINKHLGPFEPRLGERWDGSPARVFIIGSNYNQADLDKALDPATIAKFQKVLHTTEPPRWYKLVEP